MRHGWYSTRTATLRDKSYHKSYHPAQELDPQTPPSPNPSLPRVISKPSPARSSQKRSPLTGGGDWRAGPGCLPLPSVPASATPEAGFSLAERVGPAQRRGKEASPPMYVPLYFQRNCFSEMSTQPPRTCWKPPPDWVEDDTASRLAGPQVCSMTKAHTCQTHQENPPDPSSADSAESNYLFSFI